MKRELRKIARPRCSAWVYRSGLSSNKCSRAGVVEREIEVGYNPGAQETELRWLCKQHDPERKRAQRGSTGDPSYSSDPGGGPS